MTGTADGFEAFVVEQQRALLRFAMTLTGNYQRSEEMVADVLGGLFEQWERVGGLEHPGAYARRAVVNHFISQARRQTRWQRVAPRILGRHQSVTEDASQQVSERVTMRHRLDRLPPRQRAVLAMRYYLDMSDEQIAEQLGCSPATVRSHAARGLSALRVDLGDAPASGGRSPMEHTEGQD